MPELPEVTTTVIGLNETIKGLVISDVWSDYFKNTTSKSKNNIKNKKYFDYFQKEVKNKKVIDVTRRGKNVLIHLIGDKTILIHMKMTGHLLYGAYAWHGKAWKSDAEYLSDSFNQFIHLIFTFNNGMHLAFSDMRKFAKVILMETSKMHLSEDIGKLGPEPLDNMTLKVFSSQLNKRPTWKIKSALLDQTIIAGIGNIYSDEILWEAGILPDRLVKKISDEEMKKMWLAMKTILKKSIKMGGDSMSDYRNIYGQKGNFQNAHKVYRKNKEVCQKNGCGGIIQRKIIGGRSSHFCPRHQK